MIHRLAVSSSRPPSRPTPADPLRSVPVPRRRPLATSPAHCLAWRLERLEERTAPAVATWDGGGSDNNWTTAANWAGDVAPTPNAGDILVFPAGAGRLTTTNDFPVG